MHFTTHTHTHSLTNSAHSSNLQVMVNSEVSGVAFSRHPLKPLSANCVFVEAVYGLGEGLVSGELEADRYEVRQYYEQFTLKLLQYEVGEDHG